MELENIPENAEIYEETEEYIILDNQKMMPMIIWKEKNVTRDLKVGRLMKKAIQRVGEKKYGRGNFFIDRFQKGDEKYLIWYCRPNMNPELIKERTKVDD